MELRSLQRRCDAPTATPICSSRRIAATLGLRLREWDYRTTSLDPDDLADVYDMRLQVAEVLEHVNVEMRQLTAPTKAAYIEGASGGRWENSASKHKLNVLMDEVPPGKTPPLPKHIEWEGVAVPTLPLVLIAAGLFSALRDVALVLIGATSAVELAYVPNE